MIYDIFLFADSFSDTWSFAISFPPLISTSYLQERSVILSGILYLGPSLVIISILNIVAISNGTTAALPIGTTIVILIIYIFISLPLLAFGGLIGHRFRSEFQAPCATKRNPREIPPLAWFRKLPCQMFISGLLSFSAVVLELHHLYASIWGFKVFTLPSILFITFIILVILTAILSVGLTYIQLSVEDHQWWWRYLLCPSFMLHVCSFYDVIHFLLYNSTAFSTVQIGVLRGLNSHLYVWILHILLRQIKYEWFLATMLLLRV